jgi:hypothetical protein
MPSTIDPSQPPALAPTTAGVRANFLAAKNEIDALQLQAAAALLRTDDLGNRYKTSEIAGEMMCPQVIGGVTPSATAFSAGTLRMFPFTAPRAGNITALKTNITVVGAGNCRYGLYAESASVPGTPGLQLFASAELSQNALGILTAACNVPVLKGQRLFFVHHSAIAATYTSITALQSPVPYPPAALSFTAGRNMGSLATAYAALPADLTGTGWTYALAVLMMLGIVIP